MKIELHSRFTARNKRARIEMLPLIDIVFLLLVFFIYAMLSMAVHRSLPVSLPVSASAETETATRLTVTIRKGGELFLDGLPLSLGEMGSVLKEKALKSGAGAARSLLVTIFADKDISYQELYSVLDMIRSAGIADVSLQASTLR